jgi:cytochrome c biogenesis protein
VSTTVERTDQRSEDAPSRPPLTRRGPRAPLAAGWRVLRRMSTALWLLLALATAAMLAVAVPQEATAADQVAHWRAGVSGPGTAVARLLDGAGLFDVFGSWWFRGLTLLLLTSLVACLLPRTRGLARGWRAPPAAGRNLDRVRHRATFVTPLSVDELLPSAAKVLRRQRYRIRLIDASASPSGHPQLAAEAGRRARETASLTFHWSIPLLLAGVLIGQLHGFTGQVDVVVGDRFAETRLSYDDARPGPLSRLDHHRGFVISLQQFRTSQLPDGTPAEFVATVAIHEPTGADQGTGTVELPPVEVSINHPLVHDGVRLHLARYGWAPRVIVRDATGEAVFDAPVLLAAAGPLAWRGVAAMDADTALDVVWLSDSTVDDEGRPTSFGSRAPGGSADSSSTLSTATGPSVALVEIHRGRDVMRTIGTRREIDPAAVPHGTATVVENQGPAALGDWTIELGATPMWAGFQVTRTPGLRLLLAAAVLLLAGLTGSLRAYPRRVWVEAVPVLGGTRVTIAGVARHRPWTFDESFPRIVAAVRRGTQPPKH